MPANAQNPVFGAAFVPGAGLSVDLAPHGYVEEEYFITGTADAWERADGRMRVKTSAVPYVTRIIVRRPADRAAFSGVVHFEPIHPSQGGTTHWFLTAPYAMARGDVYVAASVGDDAPSRRISRSAPAPTAQSQVLKWFSPSRYADLAWPEEDGIAYEVMGHIGRLLRSDRAENPLRGWAVKAMLVGGWSFTGSIQRTYVNEGFHDRIRLPGGRAVFDGYLVGISSRWNGGGYVPLNSAETLPPPADPRRAWRKIDAPVIEFMSEFEVATGAGPQLADRNGRAGGHRLYQLGGTIHSSSMTDPRLSRRERPNIAQLAMRGYPLDAVRGETGDDVCSAPISDVAHPAYARAALDNLRQWVLRGVEPPHAPELIRADQTNDIRSIRRDATGNPLGGMPAVEFAVPLAGYGLYAGTDKPGCFPTAGRPIFVRNDLTPAQLRARYGTRAAYLARYDAAVDRAVAGRWLLAGDAREMKQIARARSYEAFGGGDK
ncbi:hypothetical protein GTZ99_02085 [Novosphingobium sp. FSY-8]|uniref:Alpha/beta hydrolase domain-containing protein n=1 Tax=Novosphingobium ovatum TaxID=1908523 RepID=A0ABW9XA06_9SPHN|nr:hypothetical protein [Novosphingobium ovatum]